LGGPSASQQREEPRLAIYHFRAKAVGRRIKNPKPGGATRRSAVAAAAYRSGERLFDNLQGKWFTRKIDPDHRVEHSVILAPDDAPAWARDRVQLWNIVERREMNLTDGKLKENAQLYREIELTLPRELSPAQRAELVEGFARTHFVAEGMIADIAIHNKTGSDGKAQPHAHIMLTMRRIETDPKKIERGLLFGGKAREWNMDDALYRELALTKRSAGHLKAQLRESGPDPQLEAAHQAAQARVKALQQDMPLYRWRAAWAAAANRALEAASEPARIDHRTLVEQRAEALASGDLLRAARLDREPQRPLGMLGHVERAYERMRDNIHGWAAIEQRGKMQRAFGHMRGRDPAKTEAALLRIRDWTEEVIDRFREHGRDKDLVPEVRLER
jgi:ATP-dependent exoDNAse (exonuclease V) alpha subunit